MATPEWRRLSRHTCAGDPLDEPRPPVERTLIFHLNDAGFHQVQPATQANGR
jgi:hypothetical protein